MTTFYLILLMMCIFFFVIFILSGDFTKIKGITSFFTEFAKSTWNFIKN